jgi:alpha-maltose-1-phosphate synthase
VSRLRVCFANSGILGHASVARLLREAAARDPSLEAEHLDLASGLGTGERVLRRMMCAGPAPGSSPAAALLLPRLRHELHAGVAAARRIAAAERAHGPFGALHLHTQALGWASPGRMRRTPAVVSIDLTQRLAARLAPSPLARADFAAAAAMDRRVFRRAAAVTATSRWVADDLLDGLPELAGRVHAMPYPVPLAEFEAEAWIRERAERAADEPVRVLFMGGDWPRKGGPGLLRAWEAAGLAARARLTLATDWPLVPPLPAGVEVRRGVRAYTPEWLALWRTADLFVLPTRAEAFGMVFQEAAAAGLPAVGTRIGAVPEIVAEGETGLLVPPGDPDALAEALLGLVEDAPLRTRMGRSARARIERTASMETYAARLSRILHEVADG